MPEITVFWIHASSSTRFEQGYRDIAEQIRIPRRDDSCVNILQVVCRWLSDEANGNWLMVLDNVDDNDVFFSLDNGLEEVKQQSKGVSRQQPLESFIPQSPNGSILVTSRSSTAARNLVGDFGDTIKVEPMNDSEALALLRTKIPCSEPFIGDAKALVEELEGIPLAITHAAAYIRNRERVTISTYLQRFRESKAEQATLLNDSDAKDLRRDHSTRHPTIFTWQITFEQIRKTTPLATDLMALMSLFDRQAIPECLLHDGTDLLQFEDAIAPLLSFSLVRQQAEGVSFEMHRLVQLSTRKWLESNRTLQRWISEALKTMAEVFPSWNYETWPFCQLLVSHSKEVLTFETVDEDDILNRAVICSKMGWHLASRDDLVTGEMLVRDALKVREKSLGPEHSITLESVSILASILEKQGKYYEAELLGRRALENNEKHLGSEHIDTMMNVSELASVLQKQGKYSEAELLSRRGLENTQKLLGSEHLITLTSMNRLALILRGQGKYKEAESLFREALEKRENMLGSGHQSVLVNMNNLALVMQDQGKYEQAQSLCRRALQKKREVFGAEHPQTLFTMDNLAAVLGKQGIYGEAEMLSREVLKIRERVLGSEHSDTLINMTYLAVILQEQGIYGEAESLNRRTLKKLKKILGSEHPETLTSMNNLAVVLEKQGTYNEANSLNRLTLEKKEKVLGPEHPSTLLSMGNLAITLEKQEKFDEAECLNRTTLEKREKILGSHHPTTLLSMGNLAYIWKMQSRDAGAVKLMKKCVLLQTRVLGVDHPATRDNSQLLSEWQSQASPMSALATVKEEEIMESMLV